MKCDSTKAAAAASFDRFNVVESVPNTNHNLPDHKNELDDSPLMENNNNGSQKTEQAFNTKQTAMHSPLQNDHGAQITAEAENSPLENNEAQKTGGAFNTQQASKSRFEGTDSSKANAAIDGHQTTAPSYYSPFIMAPTPSFSLDLAERVPLTESNAATPSFCSEEEVNSFKPDQPHDHIGSSRQAELLHSQRVTGKAKVCDDDQLEFNIEHNAFNDNQPASPSSNLFRPTGNLNLESSQANQQLPHWLTDINNDSYRHNMPPPGSAVDPFKETTQGFNFMQPRSPELSRSSLQQLFDQAVPNMQNASDSLYQHSALTRPHLFTHQPNLVATTPGEYNSLTRSSMYPFASRTQLLSPFHQINPLVPNLQHHSSMQQPRGPILPREFNFHDLSDPTLISPKLTTNQFGTQCSNSWLLQDPRMHSGSYRFPARQQTSNHVSMIPCLPNQDQHPANSELHGSSFLSMLQQPGWLNQTARPVPPYPVGSSLSNRVLNSLYQQDNGGGISAPHNMETSLTNHNEQEIFGLRGPTRNRHEEGESSSFKRFKRESSMAQTSNADQELNFFPPQNEAPDFNLANTLASRSSFSVYDPRYELLGLPVDPHLRAFAASRNR